MHPVVPNQVGRYMSRCYVSADAKGLMQIPNFLKGLVGQLKHDSPPNITEQDTLSFMVSSFSTLSSSSSQHRLLAKDAGGKRVLALHDFKHLSTHSRAEHPLLPFFEAKCGLHHRARCQCGFSGSYMRYSSLLSQRSEPYFLSQDLWFTRAEGNHCPRSRIHTRI